MSKPAWKEKLTVVKNMRKNAAGLIYERVKLLVEIYHDPQFLEDEGLDEFSAYDRLNDEVADVCATFRQLKEAIEFYPERRQWETRRIDLLVADAIAANEQQAKDLQPPRRHNRITKAMYEELERERDALKAQLERLRVENGTLREEIGVLKHEIAQLGERVSREPVAA